MKTMIIAEAAANHAGNIDIAKKMIKTAAECGADYIKFQSWQSKNLKAGDPNFERHKMSELSDEDHYTLIDECARNGIKFLTTCFDVKRVDFLSRLGLDTIKVPSTELGSIRMLESLRSRFDHIIVSTGAALPGEIEKAAEVLKSGRFTLMHCVSIYPTPSEKVNLARMNWLKQFTPSVGFSDHTMGVEAAKLAIAMGANYVEKHFTIDKSLPGKDQTMSATPDVIKEICDYARLAETMTGRADYKIYEEEEIVRKNYIGKWGDNR